MKKEKITDFFDASANKTYQLLNILKERAPIVIEYIENYENKQQLEYTGEFIPL